MKILVSSCLLGEKTRYDGNHNKINSELFEFILEYNTIFSFCPEIEGGLETPRVPAEINNNKVFTKDEKDLTKEFTVGAYKALKLCKDEKIAVALLKEKSPSCGSKIIYNGRFSNTLIEGMGICTKLLKNNNIIVFNENEIAKLLIFLKK